jgi:hypothetical protein
MTEVKHLSQVKAKETPEALNFIDATWSLLAVPPVAPPPRQNYKER